MDMNRYMGLFLAEAREHLGAAFEIQLALESRPQESSSWKELMRHAHSLKGMAATMGYESLVVLAHAVEEFLERNGALASEASSERLPLLADSLHCMARIVDRVERGASTESTRAEELAQSLAEISVQVDAAVVERAGGEAQEDVTGIEQSPELASDCSISHWRLDLLLDDQPSRSAELTVSILQDLAALGRVVQVDPPRLDLQSGRFEGRLGLLLASGLEREKLEHELREIPGLQGCSISTSAGQSASKPHRETQRWVRVRAERLDALVEELQELRAEQSRLRGNLPEGNSALRDRMERAELRLDAIYGDALEMRLVPFDTVAQRVHQAVRELARQLGKSVRFEISGAHVRLDRAVLDELIDPLLHMVRNALDHGVETADGRREAGKTEQASLALELERRGERVHLRLRDDGRGICTDSLRAAAVDAGKLSEEESRRLTRDEALMLTTWSGISTASRVSHLSGRGVGLDVVRDTVERLGGLLSICSELGTGTQVSLEVPLRMALIQTLLVRSCGELFALPMDAGLRALKRDRDSTLELIHLPSRREEDRSSGSWVVEFKTGGGRLGLLVDEVVGRREIVVKPLPPPLGSLRPYAGAAVLENGSIVLVVDPLQLR